MYSIQLGPTMFESLLMHIHRLTDRELAEFLVREAALSAP
jgi:hypothetical protein